MENLKKNGKKKLKKIKDMKVVLVVILGIAFVSCAKNREYETVYKVPEIVGKNSLVDTDTTYLYVPSTLGVPRTQGSVRAFFQGDSKLVKFKYSEKNLEIFQVDSDERFSSNELNVSPVITIPITHKDFKCIKNAQNECSQKEEENNDIAWKDKQFVLPDLAGLTVNEVNTLDIVNFDPSCASVVDSKLVNYEMNKDTLNIELERTFKTSSNMQCVFPLYIKDELKNASFKVRFSYSFVRLDSVASPDYKPMSYPLNDQRTFGFFKTEIKKLNRFYDSSRIEKQFFANRWNPNRESVDFYLDPKFYDEKNKILLDATEESFKKVNEGLGRAGVKFKLKIAGKAKSTSGDIRYSMINLLDEPQESGLLGYGPSVKNPLTGEIVQAHVNMYSGVLIQTIRRTYESMIDLGLTEAAQNDLSTIAAPAVPSVTSSSAYPVNKAILENVKFKSKDLSDLIPLNLSKLAVDFSDTKKVESILKKEQSKAEELRSNYLLSKINSEESLEFAEDKKMIELANQKMCNSDLINFAKIAKKELPKIREIDGVVSSDGHLKNWDSLTDETREKIVNLILPIVYVKTLVHELGHTLGLRHNFMGSFDKKNFYSADEAQELNLNAIPAYSSIMDYGQSELNSLGVFGKYDVAALRYGYTQKVENAKGDLIEVPSTLEELETNLEKTDDSLKRYSYCTDENAGLSSRCNRFDEGSTLTEIAQSHVENYELGYKYRYYRNGRNQFDVYGIDDSVKSRISMFRSARQIFEDYEVYVNIFGKDIMAQGCPADLAQKPNCILINDIRESSLIIARMFLDIIKTPDLTCYVENISGDNQGKKELINLESEFNKNLRFTMDHTPLGCFDSQVVKYFEEKNQKILAQGGKYLNAIKEIDPRYSEYSTDIAVRGNFHDKLLALQFLVTRYLGIVSTEDTQGSMIDIPSVANEMANYFSHILLGDKLENPVSFTDAKGDKVEVDYTLSHDSKILEQPTKLVINYFGLPLNSNVEFNREVLLVAKKFSKSTDVDNRAQALGLHDLLSVITYNSLDPISNKANDVSVTTIGGYLFAAKNENLLAKDMIDSVASQNFLDSVKKETVQKILKIKNKEFDFPAEYGDAEKTAVQLAGKLLATLINLKSQNALLTLEMLVPRVGADLANQLMLVYQLSVEQMNAVAAFVDAHSNLAADASEEEKAIFNISAAVLEDFVAGNLKTKNDFYRKSLDIMAPLR